MLKKDACHVLKKINKLDAPILPRYILFIDMGQVF